MYYWHILIILNFNVPDLFYKNVPQLWLSMPNQTKSLEHFHKHFCLVYSPLNSATLSCSSEVILTSSHTHTGPEVIFMFISPEGEFYTNGHAQRAKMIFLSLKAHWDVWVSKVVDGSYSKLENPHFLSFRRNHLE